MMHSTASIHASKKVQATNSHTEFVGDVKYSSRSPKSMSCTDLNCSFDLQIEDNHYNSFKQASKNYLMKCLNEINRETKGFSDKQIFSFTQEEFQNNLQIRGIIYKNKLLTPHQKAQFILDLQPQIDFIRFLSEIYMNQNWQISQELIYIAYKLWQGYLKFYNKKKIQKPFLQIMQRILDFDNVTLQHCQNIIILDSDRNQILKQADNQAINLASSLFFTDRNIKFLNLSDIKVEKINQQSAFEYFQIMLKIFARAVYFLIQGYFQHPSDVVNSNGDSLNILSNGRKQDRFHENDVFDEELRNGKNGKKKIKH